MILDWRSASCLLNKASRRLVSLVTYFVMTSEACAKPTVSSP